MILPPDDEHDPSAGYEEGTEKPWFEETSGRALLGHIMLTVLWVALMVAAIALCI